MSSDTGTFDRGTAKIIGITVIAAWFVFYAFGRFLALIPGLLLLAAGTVIAAKYSPPLERSLRQHAIVGKYLDKAEGFVELPLGKKVEIACVLCVTMAMDAVSWVVAGVTRLVREGDRPSA